MTTTALTHAHTASRDYRSYNVCVTPAPQRSLQSTLILPVTNTINSFLNFKSAYIAASVVSQYVLTNSLTPETDSLPFIQLVGYCAY